jgi:hypothetical protein
MSVANPLWGAPRIPVTSYSKLGMDVGQTTVAKYRPKRRRPPSQGWRTFVYNHADAIASIDMFVVPTISLGLLYPDEPSRYLIRDRDGVYGAAFIRRIRAMRIRDRPVSARSPWQNGSRRNSLVPVGNSNSNTLMCSLPKIGDERTPCSAHITPNRRVLL